MQRSSAALILGALALSAATAGCGGDSDSGGLDPVAKAAEATRNAGTAQVRFSATFETAGKSIPATGDGVFSTRDDANGRLSLTFTLGGERTTMQEILSDGALYMGGGPLAKQIPFGKKWMKIDIQKVLEEHGGDTSQIDQGGSNATKTLEYLRGAGDVQKVGSDRIRGVPTTHYHAVIDLQKVADEAGDEQLQSAIEQANGGRASVPADVWIDGKDRIRRYRMVQPMGQAKTDMTIDFVRFGVVLDADPPPSDQVFDATEVAEKQIAQEAG